MKRSIFLLSLFLLSCQDVVSDDTDLTGSDTGNYDSEGEMETETMDTEPPPECPNSVLSELASLEEYESYTEDDEVRTQDGWGIYYSNHTSFSPYGGAPLDNVEINVNKIGKFQAKYYTPEQRQELSSGAIVLSDYEYLLNGTMSMVFADCFEVVRKFEDLPNCTKNSGLMTRDITDKYSIIFDWSEPSEELSGASDDGLLSWEMSEDFKRITVTNEPDEAGVYKWFTFTLYFSNSNDKQVEVPISINSENSDSFLEVYWYHGKDSGELTEYNPAINVGVGEYQKFNFLFKNYNPEYSCSGEINIDIPDGVEINKPTDSSEVWVETKIPASPSGYNWFTLRREFNKSYNFAGCEGIKWEAKVIRPSDYTGLRWSVYDVDSEKQDEAWWNDDYGMLSEEYASWEANKTLFTDFFQGEGEGIRYNDGNFDLTRIKSFEISFYPPEEESMDDDEYAAIPAQIAVTAFRKIKLF